jgi:AAA family ATP:ADP antiporter
VRSPGPTGAGGRADGGRREGDRGLVRPDERRALGLAFATFFALLCGYYLVRPLREEMGVRGGVERLQASFTATFAAMLVLVPAWSAVVARVTRARAVALAWRGSALVLVAFWALFEAGVAPAATARALFVWVSVYNVFVVSVFWGLLADVFTSDRGKRLFGLVAAGGTAGAIAGPAAAALLARPIGAGGLLLLSAAMLEAATRCAGALGRWAAAGAPPDARHGVPLGGDALDGLRRIVRSRYLAAIAAQTVCATTVATLVYFETVRIFAERVPDSSARIALFAAVDLAVNVLGLALGSLVTGRLLTRAGVTAGLLAHPVTAAAGLVAIGAAPTLAVLVGTQALRRAVHYAIERPAREVLFTVARREEKYKVKQAVDTLVARGGDAASAWLAAAVGGAGAAAVVLVALPVAGAWAALAAWLGREARAREARARPEERA